MQVLKSSIVIAAVLAASFQAAPAYADRRIEPEKMCPKTPCLLPDLTKVNPCKAHPGSCK